MRRPTTPRRRAIAALAAAALLAGCATTDIDDNFASTQQLARERLDADVRWLTSDDARRDAQAQVDALLRRPIAADDAVRIALAYSPALQAMLFDGAAASAAATQSARLPNPVFSFERLVRNEDGARDLDIGRVLSVPVLDLLALPARLRGAELAQQQARLRLGGQVVQAALDARQAWVRAVAAGQALKYHEQVKGAADASAELARRMQSVGNFNRLQRAREQAFSADATAQLARARQSAIAAREALVRALGLTDAQAASLTLPERLPDLPDTPTDEQAVMQAGVDQRLDIRFARAELDFLAREQGLTRVQSVVNGLEIAAVRNSETGRPPQKGWELEVPLPVFDFGSARRADAQARYMAALNRAAQRVSDAASQLRETYHAMRTAHDVARHYRDEILPLRRAIAEENVLRYNGMLIGVFELLADAREQVGSVVLAIEAERDFWLADAALQGALIGQPVAGAAADAPTPSPAARSGGGH